MAKSNYTVWTKGKFLQENQAYISMLSPSSQFGLNVFEGIRCYKSLNDSELFIFRLDDHIDRLYNSAESLNLKITMNKKDLKEKIILTIIKNKFQQDSIIRVIAYVDEAGSWTQNYNCEVIIIPRLYGRAYEDKSSLTLSLSDWERINLNSMPPKIKAGANYINSRYAHIDAVNKGFDTALLLNNKGSISESTGSCIFIVKGNKLITPPISSSILDSITRKTVIKIATEVNNLQVDIREIKKDEVLQADEVFLCGTSIEIFPVSRINNSKYDSSDITSKIRDIYLSLVRGKLEEYGKWLTPVYIK
jgi:branched-chain amino acid aminotransferase